MLFFNPRGLCSIGFVLIGAGLAGLADKNALAYFGGWLVGVGSCSLWLLLLSTTPNHQRTLERR